MLGLKMLTITLAAWIIFINSQERVCQWYKTNYSLKYHFNKKLYPSEKSLIHIFEVTIDHQPMLLPQPLCPLPVFFIWLETPAQET